MKDASKYLIAICMVLVLLAGAVQAADEEKIEAPEASASKPMSFSVDYTIVSDYIFRGANFSEYAGEGQEAVNHQLGVGFTFDTAELGGVNLGTFGFSFWGEWYADQPALNTPAGTGGHIQEIDYTISWSYEVSQLFTTVELGWISYTFPQAGGGDAFDTTEWYVSLSFDDSGLFGAEESVLNPYIAYYDDVDDINGGWLEWGISHDFALADMGMEKTFVLKDITITPSFVMGIDDGQMGKSMRLANLQYGIDVGYDVSGALGIPEEYGSISLTTSVYFSDAVHNAALNDEFWGGMNLGYAW